MPGPRRTDFKKPKNAKKTFGRILQYAGKSKFMLLAVFVMLIASTVCSVGASYWLKPILNDIDASIRAGNFATVGVQSLMRNLAIVSALYIGASLCTYIQSKVMVKIAYKTTNLIRKELFDHMQTLPLRFFDTQTHGEIMSRYTNAGAVYGAAGVLRLYLCGHCGDDDCPESAAVLYFAGVYDYYAGDGI